MYKNILILLTFVFLFACGNNETTDTPNTTTEQTEESFQLSQEAAILYDTVGAKHDTAMLLMNDIKRVQSQLRKTIDGSRLKAVEERCLEKLTLLRNADKAMMDWMANFKSVEMEEETYMAMSEEAIMDYLKEEEHKIEVIHQQMLTAIQEGEQLAAELAKEKE